MTEEEYFRKNYPDSCYCDKPLSPHFDFFQDGVEFGERESEKRIAELEKENAELKESGSAICDRLSERIDETVELKNENIGLKNQVTKAKEIIKNLLILKNDHYGNTKMEWRVKVTEQAEQFLNSEVEK